MNKLLLFLTFLLATVFPSCSFSQKSVVSDIEEVFQDIKEIEVQGGPLEVTYEGDPNASEVFLNAYLESSGKNTHEITYSREGDKLVVKWEKQNNLSGWGINQSKGFISLTGPEHILLDLKSGSGSLFVKGVDHEQMNLSAGSGQIDIKDINANQIFLTAGSGRINGKDIVGEISCKVSSGSASLKNVEGDVQATASSGRLDLKNIKGIVNATVSSGFAQMDQILELGSLTASSGRIKVSEGGLGPSTQLTCSSGAITIESHQELDNYNFNLTASSGGLRVGNQSKGKHLHIDNGAPITIKGSVSSGSLSITE